MVDSSHNRRGWRIVSGLVVAAGVWLVAVAGIGGCDRNSAEQASSVEAADESSESDEQQEGKGQASSETMGAASISLPGDKEAGERQPERLGPEGPAVMFLSGLKGYLEPCGCTADVLLGGIERIVGYVTNASSLYTGTAMVDTGDLLFEERELAEHRNEPEKSSIDVLVRAVRAMDVSVTVPGELDFALGSKFYAKTLERMGLTPLAANATVRDVETDATAVKSVGEWKVGFVGSVAPELFAEIDAVEAESASAPVREAVKSIESEVDAVVSIHHGGLASAKALAGEVDGIDFVIVGHKPRENVSPNRVDGAHTLETYTQGRYVGVLGLYGPDKQRPFRNARVGGGRDPEKIEQQITHVRESLDKARPDDDDQQGDPSPIVERLEERLASLEKQKRKAKRGGVELPEEHRSFVYRSVGMRPGFPIHEEVQQARAAHNRRLKKLAMQSEREVPDVPEGEATFVGNNQCAGCHGEAHDFWKETNHASAVATLEERNKAFDDKCIGCHVVGYDKPGGSVLGKLSYEAKVDGRTIEKDLNDVGCETCHGPGSKHWSQPIGSDGDPQGIIRDPGRDACMSCHVPEHSPGFEFESYVEQVTGPGHARSESSDD